MRVFAFHGRAGRKEYFLHWLGGILAYIAALFLAVWIAMDPEAPEWAKESTVTLYLLVLLLVLVDDIGVTLRRLEDLGRPRSHFWLLFIPFYNIYLGIVLLCKPGAADSQGDSEWTLAPAESLKVKGPTSELVCSRCGCDIKWGDPFCPGCGDTIEY
jgi:uncharacterized membrane protein YhaH (DUF805 family)